MTSAAAMASALSSASALGDWRLLFLQRDRVQAVTVDDVNRVAKMYFVPHNRTLGMFYPADAPQRLSVPAVESIADVVKDYKGSKTVVAGEVFDPTPENLDSRTTIIEQDGIRIALLPKKNRGETVVMSLTLRYGNEDSLKDNTIAAGMLPSMLMTVRSGSTARRCSRKWTNSTSGFPEVAEAVDDVVDEAAVVAEEEERSGVCRSPSKPDAVRLSKGFACSEKSFAIRLSLQTILHR